LENAAALYSAWVTDVQDGAINNPIVQAVISNTDPASAGIDAWRAGLAGGDPATVPVGIGLTPESQAILANPSDPNFLARLAGSFGAGSFGASVDVSADTSQASTDLSTWKNGAEADDANVPVNAGTVGASAQMDAWRKRQAGSPVNVPVRILGGVDLWRNLTGQRWKRRIPQARHIQRFGKHGIQQLRASSRRCTGHRVCQLGWIFGRPRS
jgi:hypothetical protein